MYGRRLALFLTMGLASSAFGVPMVEVVLTPDAPGPYAPDSTVTVDVALQLVTPGSDVDVRMAQFDFNASDVLLGLTLPLTNTVAFNLIKFWDFTSTPGCAADPGTCGQDHFIEDDLVGTRSEVVSVVYLGLNSAPTLQLTIPGDGSPVNVGRLEVTVPSANGFYKLDLLNAGELDPAVGGAEVHFDFGLPLDPWTARDGEIIGGTLALEVGPTCTPAAFVSSSIACEKSLPWATNGVIRLTFAAPVVLPVPGEIEIRELLAGGGFGPDLSANFTYSLESGDTVLRIEETGPPLVHETWYAVMNTGVWCSAALFRRNYEKVVGDADNNRVSDLSDLGVIFGNFSPPAPADDDRNNIDQNVSVDLSDLGVAFGNSTGAALPIPSGHAATCSP